MSDEAGSLASEERRVFKHIARPDSIGIDPREMLPPPATATRGADWKKLIPLLIAAGILYAVFSDEKPVRRSKLL